MKVEPLVAVDDEVLEPGDAALAAVHSPWDDGGCAGGESGAGEFCMMT